MSITNQVSFIAISIIVLLFAIKYFQKVNYQRIDKRRIPLKWMLWFSKYDIYSTTTDSYRRYMKTSNGLSVALLVSVLLTVIVFLTMGYTRARM